MKRRFLSLFCTLALILSILPTAGAAKSISFSDVTEGQWHYPYVTELAEAGGTTGYPDGTFRPDNQIKLVELATMALGALPIQDTFPEAQWPIQSAEAENGNYWGNRAIAAANNAGVSEFGYSKTRWEQPATREEMAWLLSAFYSAHIGDSVYYQEEAAYLIGDYYTAVAGSDYEGAILWMYGDGIISGMNANGDFCPKDTTTRAQACTMLLALLHPERWTEVDWDAVVTKAETKLSQPATRLADGTDFTGAARMRYDLDVAYDFCRSLEKEIGIQIFYLPEWTEKDAGVIHHSDFDAVELNSGYFHLVLAELRTMKAAYDLYPEGFLKEMAQKKGSRKAEIILCPYTFDGMSFHGEHVYDYSGDAKKVDQLYYTGSGSPYAYSHEMGHMVMSCAAIRNGWNTTCSTWEGYMMQAYNEQDPYGFVSQYAMTSRPEDWAETWAYLWHATDFVQYLCENSSTMQAKVDYMTKILVDNYSTVDRSDLPWTN